MYFTLSIIFAFIVGINEGLGRLLPNKREYEKTILSTFQAYCFKPNLSWRNKYTESFIPKGSEELKATGLDFTGADSLFKPLTGFQEWTKFINVVLLTLSTLCLAYHCNIFYISNYIYFSFLWMFLSQLAIYVGIRVFDYVIEWRLFTVYCKIYFFVWKTFLRFASSKNKRKEYKKLPFIN